MSEEAPQVYIATYSSTDVYECQIQDTPIMRRCKDDWVNATQILKCCNFPKAKRTKILEKGVQQGLHEKIQGGYGRFQGTWIPLPDAQRLATNYGVTPEMAPVLFLDVNDVNIKIPKKNKQMTKDGTPVKRKYTKRAKKEESSSKKPKGSDSFSESQDIYGYNPYGSLQRYPSQSSQTSQSNPYQVSGGQMPNAFTQADFMNMNRSGSLPTFTLHQQVVQNEFQNYQYQMQRYQDQNQKMANGLAINGAPMPMQLGVIGHSKLPLSQSTNETTWSHDDAMIHKDSDTSLSSSEENSHFMKGRRAGLDSLGQDDDYSYGSQLLQFFSEDKSEIPYFIHNPPYDFNINEAIDDEGHTALHWAASIGNHQMIRLLLSKGANPLTVNNFGLNALSKLISFNNCYEMKNFPKVLDDLELCLINTDINGRTPLHYLCQFAKVKSKYESSEYYMNVVLNKLTTITSQTSNEQVNLLKNVLDHQDVNGDTALHLAIKASNVKLSKILLAYGARNDLENVNKETSKYLLSQSDLLSSYDDHSKYNNVSLMPSISSARNKTESSHQGLATPVQQSFNGSLGTPDTQRTAIQDDEDDDYDDSRGARVNKDQIDHLMKEDNKENIFIDSSALKIYDSTSTPLPKSISDLTTSSHQPLAVITERTTESTPTRTDDKLEVGNEIKVFEIKPPSVDESGKVVEGNESDVPLTKLKQRDLSSMFNVMINSLTSSYSHTLEDLDKEYEALQEDLSRKEHLKDISVEKIKTLLERNGISNFGTLEDGETLLEGTINENENELSGKEVSLSKLLEKDHFYKLASLLESQDVNEEEESDDKEEQFRLAIELTNLQIKRLSLLKNAKEEMKTYGLDPRTYKYRKLVSLSCGLKIEDIDGLIDGINESLSDTPIFKAY